MVAPESTVEERRPIGLVLARPAQILGAEPYYHEFVAGAERVLAADGRGVLLHVVPTREEEIACYRRWALDRHVDGVFLTDLTEGDPRIEVVRELGFAAVAMSDPDTGGGLDTVWTQDGEAMEIAVRYLAGLGHERIAHVSGPTQMMHTRIRTQSFDAVVDELGLSGSRIVADYTQQGGHDALVRLVDGELPVGVVFDNDLMAIGALEACAERGLRVPGDVSLLAWDDSPLTQLAVPSLSAMSHDVQRVGESAGQAMLRALAGQPPRVVITEHAKLVARESTPAAALS